MNEQTGQAPADMEVLAQRFFDALQAADVGTVQSLYSEGATLWTCITQRDVKAREVATYLPYLAKKMPDRRYEDRRVTQFKGGFMQRHRLCGTRRDGARVAAQCCVMVFVENGKIYRVEEYLDSRQFDAVMG